MHLFAVLMGNLPRYGKFFPAKWEATGGGGDCPKSTAREPATCRGMVRGESSFDPSPGGRSWSEALLKDEAAPVLIDPSNDHPDLLPRLPHAF